MHIYAPDIEGGKGNAESLFISDVPKPNPKGDQALVRIKAFGLNRMDLLQREGKYPVPPQAPATLGVEFSGVIETTASEVESGFKAGDEVFGLAYGGEEVPVKDCGIICLIQISKPEPLSCLPAASRCIRRVHCGIDAYAGSQTI